ncbi:MAG: hypothetical protein DDG60_17105 [Anaerolineae bacterium]|nr:MAG: hypothetical protein DDG60_17105 [Anaerolineae bacterium]
MKYPHVEAYIRRLAEIPWANKKGPSAQMAAHLQKMLNEKGVQAVVGYAHAMRHDSDRLANGAFTQIVNICALANLDRHGKIDPFIPSDLTRLAREVAGL